MAAYLPPGWPAGVHPPGSEGFERTAVAWLLDVVPPDYRLHGVLRRHPVALATMARHHVTACVEGARAGYRSARTELGDVLPPPSLDAMLAAYRSEGERLVATARAVDLIVRALRGERFQPRLRAAGSKPPERAAAGAKRAAGSPAEEKPAGRRPTEEKPAERRPAEDKRGQRRPAEDKRARRQAAERRPAEAGRS